METSDEDRWKARLNRERAARKEAERLLEAKSRELYDANQELHALLGNLEARVEERTRELDEARIAAEKANEAKSRFLATMSHEIRTPMNGVVGMADYLVTTPLNDDQARCVSAIQGASSALRRILDDILDLSRLESNRLELAPTTFDIHEMVENVIGLFLPEAKRRDLFLTATLDPTLPRRVIADRVRLGQILANLVGNAIKFTHKGGVTLEVGWKDRALVLTVTDTGIGIPEEARAKLFTRFTQADASTTRTYGGSGLGLAICRELVELMGGVISLDAPSEGGSRFTVLAPVDLPEAEEVTPKGTNTREGATPIQGLSVLVVDDNDINREVATRLLCKVGCDAESVAHGQGALDLLRERTFDIVFMDVQMPGMDGYETTRRIRAMETETHHPRVPIIALTADAVEGVEDSCRAAGMDSYLTKPVTRATLTAKLANFMT